MRVAMGGFMNRVDWFLLAAGVLVIRSLVWPSWELVALAGVVLAARYGAALTGLGDRLGKVEVLLEEVKLKDMHLKLTRLVNHTPPSGR
jgi:hypothetical protein